MLAKKKRIEYLDVCKGLLILLVVVHHIPYIAINLLGIENSFLESFKAVRKLTYMPFFITTFVMITGMCSNYKTDFKTFWTKNVMSLLLPSVLLSFFVHWFIGALFLSKIAYWLIVNKVRNQKIVWCIIVTISLLGCYLNKVVPIEPLSCFHAMGFCIYLHIGATLKQYILNYKFQLVGGTFYVVIMYFLCYQNFDIPYFENGYHVYPTTFPLHTFLACSGAGLVLLASRMMESIRFLQYIGKNSIIILLIHFPVLKLLLRYSQTFFNDYKDVFGYSFLFFILVFLITVIIMLICSIILNTRYGRYIIGKV